MVTDKRFRSYTACEDGAKGWCLLWFPAATQVQLARILHHFTCTSYRVAGGYSHVLEPFQYDSSSQKWREAASWHRWQEKYQKDCPSKCIFPDCPSQRLNWARPVVCTPSRPPKSTWSQRPWPRQQREATNPLRPKLLSVVKVLLGHWHEEKWHCTIVFHCFPMFS